MVKYPLGKLMERRDMALRQPLKIARALAGTRMHPLSGTIYSSLYSYILWR